MSTPITFNEGLKPGFVAENIRSITIDDCKKATISDWVSIGDDSIFEIFAWFFNWDYFWNDIIPTDAIYDEEKIDFGKSAPYAIIATAEIAQQDLKCVINYYSAAGLKGISKEDYKFYSDNNYYLTTINAV